MLEHFIFRVLLDLLLLIVNNFIKIIHNEISFIIKFK